MVQKVRPQHLRHHEHPLRVPDLLQHLLEQRIEKAVQGCRARVPRPVKASRLCGQDDAPCLPQRGRTSEHALFLLEGQGCSRTCSLDCLGDAKGLGQRSRIYDRTRRPARRRSRPRSPPPFARADPRLESVHVGSAPPGAPSTSGGPPSVATARWWSVATARLAAHIDSPARPPPAISSATASSRQIPPAGQRCTSPRGCSSSGASSGTDLRILRIKWESECRDHSGLLRRGGSTHPHNRDGRDDPVLLVYCA
jgi:hypothetical protein